MSAAGNEAPAPSIGIVGLPQIATAVPFLGLNPITDEHAPSAIAAIQAALSSGIGFPVVISDTVLERISPWLLELCASTHVVVTTASMDPSPIHAATNGQAYVVGLPNALGDLLAASGYSGVDPTWASIPVSPEGTLLAPQGSWPEQALSQATEPTHEPVSQEPAAESLVETAAPKHREDPVVSEPSFEDVVEHNAIPATDTESTPQISEQPDFSHQPTDWTSEPADLDAFIQEVSGTGTVVAVWSAKGGVGKTSTAFGLAQRAGQAGLKTLLIDANSTQGDLRTVLRSGASSLPSIFQAVSSEPSRSLIDPDALNSARSLKLERLTFWTVQAPSPNVPSPELVTPALYRKVLGALRSQFDLVVIDTPAVTAFDTSGMTEDFLVPVLLSPNTFGVGISDSSQQSVNNILARLKGFLHEGISQRTQVTFLNRVSHAADADLAGIASALANNTTHLGLVYNDAEIEAHMNRGRPIADLPTLASMLDAVLLVATNRSDVFAGQAPQNSSSAPITSGKEKKVKEVKIKDTKPPKAAKEPKKEKEKAPSSSSDSIVMRLISRGK